MTVERIKAAALKQFAQHGYDGASLSDIAKEAGIKTPSIYAHFKSKEDLFLSVFDDLLKLDVEQTIRLAEQIETKTVKEKLHAILIHYCKIFATTEQGMFWQRAMFFPPEFLRETLQMWFANYESRLTGILISIFEEAIDTGVIAAQEPSDLLAAYYCMLDGLSIECHYYSPDEYERRIAAVWSIFWNGLQAQR
ncbi:TetR/AcrR family transcriptional regulator [Brevibacillus humidisoli]|uniref:TetR/AcrR family transcriptional regulator n=1 Tax=Brevibacillus humidisoli TaxID=2895522 RepID=UPI001E350955|nr:TetR/AcrR family transcriptional regulator [Brevibacillus humidisoli]UFJ42689.1 TetR/AcrR family transcriptional regulator [Brevibacillus humidisoli]